MSDFDINAVIGKYTGGPAFDPKAIPDVPATDVGPAARRAKSGRGPSDPKVLTDEAAGVASPADYGRDIIGRQRTEPGGRGTAAVAAKEAADPIANDPLAQSILASTIGAGAGMLVGPAVAAFAPAVAPAVSAAASGATAAEVTGEDPLVGAAAGALLPLAGAVYRDATTGAASRSAGKLFQQVGRASPLPQQQELERIGEERFNAIADTHGVSAAPDPRAAAEAAASKVEGEIRDLSKAHATATFDALPAEEKLYRQVGQLAGPTGKAKIDQIGKDKVVAALQRAGVTAMPDAATAAPVIKAAEANVGQKIGSAYSALDSSGARWSTTREALDAMDKVKAALAGSTASKPEADALGRFMKDFLDAHGGNESAPISAQALNKEIGALQAKGFAAKGVELSPSTSARLGRDVAKVLDEVLNDHLERASRFSPSAKVTTEELRALNQDYRVIKTVKPFVAGRAAAERFAKPVEAEAAVPVERLFSRLPPAAAPKVDEYKALRAIGNAFAKKDAETIFAPTTIERVGDAAAHPVKTAGNAARAVVAAPVSALRSADAMLAYLHTLNIAGQTATPELLQQAAKLGVAPAALAHFARPEAAPRR